VDLYIHFPIRLHGVVLNKLSTGTTLPYYVDAQKVMFSTNCRISVATVEFILHISTCFGISYTFLRMLHETTFFVIFFFTFISNWKVPTFLYVFWLNTLLIVSSTLQKTFFCNDGEIRNEVSALQEG
jgi:hypothetical protein